MKKYLSLLLAMLMLVTSVGFNAFATGETCTVHKIGNTEKVYPTCTEEGYTVTKCKICGAEMDRVYDDVALDHQYNAGEYVAVKDQEGAFTKVRTCTRWYRDKNNESVQCGATATETEGGKPVIYYLVSFVNNKAPKTTYPDMNGVELIDTKEFDSNDIVTYYVKEGTVGTYNPGTPYLGKTAQFGRHTFAGWTTKADLGEIKASYDKSVYADINTPIEGKTTFYPIFIGEQVEYAVTFNSLTGPLTNPVKVAHGKSVYYRENANPSGKLYEEPVKDEDLVNYYDFAGWSTQPRNKIGIATLSLEKVPIHNITNYYPTYKENAKNYRVEFYTYDMKLIDTFDDVNLDTNLYTEFDARLKNFDNPDYLLKPSSKTHNFVWTGSWRILQHKQDTGEDVLGGLVKLGDFNISSNNDFYVLTDTNGKTVYVNRVDTVEQLDESKAVIKKDINRDEPVKVIRLVPEYDERLIAYHVGIKMSLPVEEDPDYYRGGAAVRIFDYKGNIVTSGTTEADGTFRCTLNYIEGRPYTVKITTSDSKYLGEAVISNSFQKSEIGDAYEEAMILNICSVNMTRNPEYETSCSCIHHNPLIQPIWVRILNLLYTFFNVRYECCYDMYSTIGPVLDYTRD